MGKKVMSPKRNRVLLWLGVVLCVQAVALNLFYPKIRDAIVKAMLKFEPGTYAFEQWRLNSEPYPYDIYFFNWTNPQDVNNASIKPQFKEVGPYKFHMFLEKVNVTVHENGTSTYTMVKKYIKNEDGVSRPFSDLITTLNPIPYIIAYQAREWNYLAKLGLSLGLRSSRSTVHVTKTVDELLFEGFNDPILDAVNTLPLAIVPEKFGFYYKKNYTDLKMGPLTFRSLPGETFGEVVAYKGQNHTNLYPPPCNGVVGVTGEFTRMHQDTNDVMKLFPLDITAFISLHYEGSETIKGINGNRYETDYSLFDNGTYDPLNRCFCNGDCLPAGVLNMSSQYDNAPVYISLPHFARADPVYINSVEGVHLNGENDLVYAIYEPASGVLLSVGLRIQINMFLRPIRGIGLYSNVPTVMMPIFHINQTVSLNDQSIDRLKILPLGENICYYSTAIMFIVGIAMIAFVFVKTARTRILKTAKSKEMEEIRREEKRLMAAKE